MTYGTTQRREGEKQKHERKQAQRERERERERDDQTYLGGAIERNILEYICKHSFSYVLRKPNLYLMKTYLCFYFLFRFSYLLTFLSYKKRLYLIRNNEYKKYGVLNVYHMYFKGVFTILD